MHAFVATHTKAALLNSLLYVTSVRDAVVVCLLTRGRCQDPKLLDA